MIASDSWNSLVLSSYDYNKMGVMGKFGTLHVVYDFVANVREALFELGFKEVQISNYVEKYSEEDAEKALAETEDAYSIHLKENTDEEAVSNTYSLRSSLFNRLLSELSTFKSVPSKLFTIGKVFRNREFDSLDIPEYHSLEMMISDIDLDLSNILGICVGLFSRLNIGYTDFKQAYFPYTSPTVGVYLYNEILDAWISVGKGGIVRPEVMKKLGYNDNMFILRLGFSIERILLNKKETDDMSHLLWQREI
nr:phenylalanine--tRNA ligase alpha subunit B-like [Halyomorpha halys]